MQTSKALSDKRPRQSRVLFVLCLALIGVVVIISFSVRGRVVQGVDVEKVSLSVTDPRPLAKAIESLEATYGWVITYEDPLYTYDNELVDVTMSVRRDLDKFEPGQAPRVLIPKGGTLTVNYDVAHATKQPSDPLVVIQRLLDANSTSGNAGVFRLESSGQFMHVIPTASRNKDGELTPQKSPLDAVITLYAEKRTVEQMLETICAAISKATQTQVLLGTIPVGPFFQKQDQPGGANQKARDLLVATLEGTKSKAKLSWQLLYDPGMKKYFLNIQVVPS